MMARIPGHFRARVAQRLGPHVDVDQLHARILKSVLTGDDEFCRFALRQSGDRRVYWFPFEGERRYVVIARTAQYCHLITILEPGWSLPRRKASRRKILK